MNEEYSNIFSVTYIVLVTETMENLGLRVAIILRTNYKHQTKELKFLSIIIGCVLSVIVAFGDFRQAYYITVFTAIFPIMSFIKIGAEDINVNHILGFIFFLRFLSHHKDFKFDRWCIAMLIFLAYCFVSIFWADLNAGSTIFNLEARVGKHPGLNFQQFTQYIYLLYANIYMFITYNLLKRGEITLKGIFKLFDWQYITVILLGFGQFFIPAFDEIFRNKSFGVGYKGWGYGIRMSSTFPEPSMLSLFLAPLTCMYLYDVFHGNTNRTRNYLCIVGGFAVSLLNLSSSFVLGILFLALMYCWNIMQTFLIKRTKSFRMRPKQIIKIIAIIFVMLLLFMAFQNEFAKTFNAFIDKLQGRNASGVERTKDSLINLQVFLQNIFIGVGFGTVRSSTLIVTWLTSLGLIGFSLYVLTIAKLCRRLMVINSGISYSLLIMIVIYNVILMISVPEFEFLFIWIYYATGFYLSDISKNREVSCEGVLTPERFSL